jgi:hypothetical protein
MAIYEIHTAKTVEKTYYVEAENLAEAMRDFRNSTHSRECKNENITYATVHSELPFEEWVEQQQSQIIEKGK